MTRPKDINSPSRWNMRIWDVNNQEWLGENDSDSLTYYGFDIRGGEVTIFQCMDWVYKRVANGRELIWEQSTGLRDKNGAEIYEGDIIEFEGLKYAVEWSKKFASFETVDLREGFVGSPSLHYLAGLSSVVGNIHENPELLGGEE